MQKDIFKEDYFQTLMCIMVDESRRLLRTMGKEFQLSKKAYDINAEMTRAGNYLNTLPEGYNTIVHTTPQDSVRKAEQSVMSEYRKQAVKLIEHFVESCKEQGADPMKVDEHFERMYKWKAD